MKLTLELYGHYLESVNHKNQYLKQRKAFTKFLNDKNLELYSAYGRPPIQSV